MLSGKQKRYLRKKAHHIKPIFQVGKAGVNPELIQQIGEALEARELIKVSVLQNCPEDKSEAADAISRQADADVVQVIGSTIILYKESQENKTIDLPSA
ncbi:ribosome assembly RNA-binding protein YhbY [Salisediminibacterium halotolerans]|uniref:RNA-binding protein n=1 Tax=Salisediminibacterium halotolerans TaxID=517425 RepID=A0A1H9S497_9BACI|nr:MULTISPECIES: ribosome assembly RNA-binding protein YhbY [Salisediminibacterium]RLJ78182.1 RNA-binding protein [Actinophytocola xinjiangensis]RPE88479.1 RNA-binding protein [Salisediminibacterium halotolerans]TWG37159.1 RNA-binding protein [Salisediminibacterium halotolerans]SER79784.1 RNA-binding protein [Salisediminibacterium haloalkalitolerans]GEL08637.1 putative RNA-binding protein YqeI [Salisediminibacterium halotolerans]